MPQHPKPSKERTPTPQPHEALNIENMGLCVTEADKTVRYQNETCKTICGDHMDQSCHQCDDLPTSEDTHAPPSRHMHTLQTTICEMYRFPTKNNTQMTVFYPADKIFETFRAHFEERQFTPQEKEIGFLILQNYTNPGITQKLFISLWTLKTHLHHMYQKCPELKAYRKKKHHLEIDLVGAR